MVQDNINKFKIWSPPARHRPHLAYAAMRAEEPVYRAVHPETGIPFWFITRYDDCNAVLRDPRIGRDYRNLTPEAVARYDANTASLEPITRYMLNLDPPDHTRLRGLVSKA